MYTDLVDGVDHDGHEKNDAHVSPGLYQPLAPLRAIAKRDEESGFASPCVPHARSYCQDNRHDRLNDKAQMQRPVEAMNEVHPSTRHRF
jgi:hypothetical protein